MERINNTIASYLFFTKSFPEDTRIKDAKIIYEKSIKQLEKFNNDRL